MNKEILGNKIKDAFNVLISASEDVNKVPEEVFKHIFLPIFLNKDSDTKATIGDWAAIAGNPFKPVDVVDASGVVIFRVPSVFDREVLSISTSKDRVTSTGHIMVTYSQLLAVSPAKAEHYLKNQMSSKIKLDNLNEKVINRIKLWNIIFERYGIETIKINESSNSSSSNSDVSMVYDDDIL